MAGNLPGKDKGGPKTLAEAMDLGLGYAKDKDGKTIPPVDPSAPPAKVPAAEKPAGAEKPATPPKVEGEQKPKPPAKPEANPLYAMPDGLGPQARDRFKALTDGHKALAAELETERQRAATFEPQVQELTTQRDSFRQILTETDTSTDELSQFFSYKQHLKDGNYKGAAGILQNQLRQLALQTGEEFGEVDPLEEFEDLRDEVENHQISKERALEIARARVGARVSQSAEETRRGQDAQAQQVQQAKEAAVLTISQWAKTVAAKDIDYSAKQTKLMPRITAIMEKYPPAMWLQAVQDAYEAMEAPAALKPATDEPIRPLRPSAGGGRPAATSMGQAINRGLGYEN